ncbi:hypothetical protein [Stenotrophomonas maltophilia]|uniref:hypothetical protein n=1 Tax=Stenotrophomonas maltophilia TaxID=40324 RepID=UPI00066C579D|nr:hypothetical protein [Stenotrophomonas maltophilia]
MSMLDGVSQCWLLSETCVVNWDAWAAIGTVAAVFTAVFAPEIQRLLVRKKTNAMFALAYRTDLFAALDTVERLRSQYPFGQGTGEAFAAEALLLTDESFRAALTQDANALDVLMVRDVDLTKWPGVDVRLAAKVALAVETTRNLHKLYTNLAVAGRDGDAGPYFYVAEHIGKLAAEHLSDANSDVDLAIRPITKSDQAEI